MASSTLLSIILTTACTLLFLQAGQAQAATPAPASTPAAPAPTAAPLNLTAVLEKGSQYTTLIRLLKETQIGEQVDNQLNNSFGGMTLFAPTDNAFNNLKPGALNSLTAQQQAALILYHVLPRYYSLVMFSTASNPVNTQASGSDGVYKLNITSSNNQVNVSTGVNQAPVNNALYNTFPLAVYSIDSVLLPSDLFGPKPPAPAPTADVTPKSTAKAPSAASKPADATSSTSAASFKGRSVGWSSVAGIGLMAIGMALL